MSYSADPNPLISEPTRAEAERDEREIAAREWTCPRCGLVVIPPAVNPSSYRLCGRCGLTFAPDDAVRS